MSVRGFGHVSPHSAGGDADAAFDSRSGREVRRVGCDVHCGSADDDEVTRWTVV